MIKPGYFRHRDPGATGAKLDAMMFLARAEHRRVTAYRKYKWDTYCRPALKRYIEKATHGVDVASKAFGELSDKKKFNEIKGQDDFRYLDGGTFSGYFYSEFIQSDWGDALSDRSRYNSYLDNVFGGEFEDSDGECDKELNSLIKNAADFARNHEKDAKCNSDTDELLKNETAIKRYGSMLPLNFAKYRAETIDRYVKEGGKTRMGTEKATRGDDAVLFRNVSTHKSKVQYEIYTQSILIPVSDTYAHESSRMVEYDSAKMRDSSPEASDSGSDVRVASGISARKSSGSSMSGVSAGRRSPHRGSPAGSRGSSMSDSSRGRIDRSSRRGSRSGSAHSSGSSRRGSGSAHSSGSGRRGSSIGSARRGSGSGSMESSPRSAHRRDSSPGSAHSSGRKGPPSLDDDGSVSLARYGTSDSKGLSDGDEDSSMGSEEINISEYETSLPRDILERVINNLIDSTCIEIRAFMLQNQAIDKTPTMENKEAFRLLFLSAVDSPSPPLSKRKEELDRAVAAVIDKCKQKSDYVGYVDTGIILPSHVAPKTFNGLFYNKLDCILDIRGYVDFAWKCRLMHPWVTFLHFYTSRHRIASANLFEIKTPKYTIEFKADFDEGDIKGPFVICTDISVAPKATSNFFIYSGNVAERERDTVLLKQWVENKEKNGAKKGEEWVDGGFNYAPLHNMSDIASYRDTGEPPHKWALFLQFFIGSMFDSPAIDSERTIRPMEYFFETGVIYGNGYTLSKRSGNKITLHIYKPAQKIREYEIYSSDATENDRQNISLRRDIELLENKIYET